MPGTTVEEDFSGAIFAAFGVGPEAFLGRGGEAAELWPRPATP
jgi:hypothetical protein